MAAPTGAIEALFDLGELPELKARYNIAPSQRIPAVMQPDATRRRFGLLKWGLVPFWAKDPAIGNRLINARSETVAKKPAFRAAMRYRRCLLPADGFYEWSKTPEGKQPVYAQLHDGELFAFAGLWESWQGPGGEVIDSAVVLTTRPNELLEPVHNRMPVILAREDYGRWLDPDCTDPRGVEDLLGPLACEQMRLTPVSRYVNNPANEGPRCIQPDEGT
jgi:putative SOS response-associated peptidase YedK